MVILEALARGIPMLVSPACAEHVGEAGRVVASDKPEAWAREIEDLLTDSKTLNEMSAAGLERAKLHEINIVQEEWLSLYNSMF